jgi:hypothetical protein
MVRSSSGIAFGWTGATRPENTNHWRAITRLNVGVQVAHQPRVAPHFAAKPIEQHPTMNRDDALFWLSVFWFVGFCGVAIWLLLVP